MFEKQKCPKNFNVSIKNAISAILKYYLSNSINLYFHAQLEMLTPEEALPIILEIFFGIFGKLIIRRMGLGKG